MRTLYTFGNSNTLELTGELITEAIASFTKGIPHDGVVIGGYMPKAIALHPWLLEPDKAWPEFRLKYKHLNKELAPALEALKARGMEVKADAGIHSWRVAIIADYHQTEDSFYNTPSQIEAQGPVPVGKSVVESGGFVLLPPHRPRVFGEDIDHRIEALMEKGLGARAIHRILTADGVGISLSSISKRLQQFRIRGADPGNPNSPWRPGWDGVGNGICP